MNCYSRSPLAQTFLPHLLQLLEDNKMLQGSWRDVVCLGCPVPPQGLQKGEDVQDTTINSTLHFVFVNFEKKMASLCPNSSYLQDTDNLQFSQCKRIFVGGRLTIWDTPCVSWQFDISQRSSVMIPLNSVLMRDSDNCSCVSPDVGLSIFPDSAANNGT